MATRLNSVGMSLSASATERSIYCLGASVTIDGRVYAVPLDFSGWGIYYNRDLFTAAELDGFPTTFSGPEDAVAALKEAGTVPFGLALQAAWTIGQVVTIGGSPALYGHLTADMVGLLSGDFDFDRPASGAVERALNSTNLALLASTTRPSALPPPSKAMSRILIR